MNPLRRLYRFWRTPEKSGCARFFGAFIAGVSWISVLMLWLVALTPYVDPRIVKYAAPFSLAFPLMLGGVLVMLVLSLLFAPRRSWIPLLGLLVVSGSIRTYAPINPFRAEPTGNFASEVRVMTYNTQGFGITEKGRAALTRYIIGSGAHIIAFQEGMGSLEHNKELVRRLRHSATPHYKCYNTPGEALGLISSYPITDAQLVCKSGGNIVVAFWLKVPGEKPWIVVNCHLRSNALSVDDRGDFRRWVSHRGNGRSSGRFGWQGRLVGKVGEAAMARADMVDTLARFVDKHRDQVKFVCGDFNDTPISFARRRVADLGFSDAFRSAGNGVGRTFNRDAMYVRIDHLFADPGFTPVEAHVDNTIRISDHFPLVATFRRPGH